MILQSDNVANLVVVGKSKFKIEKRMCESKKRMKSKYHWKGYYQDGRRVYDVTASECGQGYQSTKPVYFTSGR